MKTKNILSKLTTLTLTSLLVLGGLTIQTNNITAEEFDRDAVRTHAFKFEDNLEDSENAGTEASVVGSKINEEGGQIQYVDGKNGKAVYFDGETGILLPNNLLTSDKYSVSMWINPEELTAHTTTFFGAQTDESWLSLVPESGEGTEGKTMLWSGTEWYDGNTGTQISVDEWSHLTFTVNKGDLNIYINGIEVFVGEGFPDLFVEDGSVFSLGVNYWDTAFKGMMDELMVYNGQVLNQDDITALASGENLDETPESDEGDSELDETDETDKNDDEVTDKGEKNTNKVLIAVGVLAVVAGVATFIVKSKKKDSN